MLVYSSPPPSSPAWMDAGTAGRSPVFPAFKQAVEQDMVAGILADAYQFSSEDLRRRRAESVQNVRKTNGRISLEQRVRGAWEEDDEWQD